MRGCYCGGAEDGGADPECRLYGLAAGVQHYATPELVDAEARSLQARRAGDAPACRYRRSRSRFPARNISSGLVQKLPTYQERLTSLQETATQLLSARGLNISTIRTLEIFSPNRLVGVAGSVLGSIGNVLEEALLIIFLVAILLFEFAGRQTKPGVDLVDLTVMSRLQDASRDVKKYVAITGGIGLLQSTACLILLLILGVDFPSRGACSFFSSISSPPSGSCWPSSRRRSWPFWNPAGG